MITESDESLVFSTQQRVYWQAVAFLAGGTIFLAILFLRFLMLIHAPARPGDEMIPGLIGGVSVVGIGLIARGIFLLRSIVRVVVDFTGVHLETFFGRRTIHWTEIDRVERDKKSPILGGKSYEVLRLIGKSGRTLAALSEIIFNFEILAGTVIIRSSGEAQHLTYDSAADEQRRVNREVRKIKWVASGFGFFTLFAAICLCIGINTELHLRRFATEAEHIDAEIVRREMVRVTPHIEYTFKVGGQRYTRDATMWQGPDYDALEGKSSVPVEYLNSEPGWNRLVTGENHTFQLSGNFLWIAGGLLIMFGTLFIVTLLGFDLKSENGVTTLSRWGRTIKTWGMK